MASDGVKLLAATPFFEAGGVQPLGLNPSGGLIIKNAPIKFTTKNTIPYMENVLRTPYRLINVSATGVNKRPPNPRADTIIPVTKPLLSGNHF